MKSCPICNKGSHLGGGYSNRTRATQFNPTGTRRRQPNLQWAKMPNGKRVKICTTCIKGGKNLTAK
jgi:ribosomal protein L28